MQFKYALAVTDAGDFLLWAWIRHFCVAGIVLFVLWNVKCSCMVIQENFLVWFSYTDLHIFINLFTANPRYIETCVENVLGRSATSPDQNELTMDLMLINMMGNIVSLYYFIGKACELTVLQPIYCLHWFLTINVTGFQVGEWAIKFYGLSRTADIEVLVIHIRHVITTVC